MNGKELREGGGGGQRYLEKWVFLKRNIDHMETVADDSTCRKKKKMSAFVK